MRIEDASTRRWSSPIEYILRKMAKQDFVYHCWQWLAVTSDFYTCSKYHVTTKLLQNVEMRILAVAEIDTNSIFKIL